MSNSQKPLRALKIVWERTQSMLLCVLCCPVVIAVAAHERAGQYYASRPPKPRCPATLDAHGMPLSRPAHQDIVPRTTQSQSLFLTKLPPEIRAMIYEQTLGGHVIHLKAVQRVLEAYDCHWPDGWKCACGHFARNRRRSFGYRHKPLQMLMTCMQIYQEAILFLYSTNTFCMRMEAFSANSSLVKFYLPAIMQPDAFNAIRSLQLVRRITVDMPPAVPYGLDTPLAATDGTRNWTAANRAWGLIWKTIASMKSLQHLRVDITSCHRDDLAGEQLKRGWLENEPVVVRLVEVQAKSMELKTFEMVMPYRESLSEMRIGGRVWPLGKPPIPWISDGLCGAVLSFRTAPSVLID
ncbi:hypothetical protein BU16DRAFT_22 [Lophium mytilinum]|uniref:DUF7730 domain-containing protein n=1 Tax=Lophium mytilinum TaxID=390894 RepID=A0A6A6RAW0_9PEZI|nr:hypothetical protein BU16DRAFT_22 [Lophium mytilinum]